MKEEILKLRSEGKTYDQIKEILGCSKGTIAYHCGDGQKEKTRNRVEKYRSAPLMRKIENFKARRALKSKTEKFQCRVLSHDTRKIKTKGANRCSMKNIEMSFRSKDVIEKFGQSPKCALSGRDIDWEDSYSYTLDHIIPATRGGDNSINNLQLLHPQVNLAKSNLTDEEFIALCKEVLEYRGFQVSKT